VGNNSIARVYIHTRDAVHCFLKRTEASILNAMEVFGLFAEGAERTERARSYNGVIIAH
jgi:hypothetical protein